MSVTVNPIYGFIGRSSFSTAMMVSRSFSGVPAVLQAALALGADDPTAHTIAQLASSLQGQRVAAGLPTDDASHYHSDRLYARSDDGLAFIPVWGMLLNKCDWACSYFTGYDYLYNAVSAAQADSAVKGIVFDIDSFGGEAQGCMELSAFLRDQRGGKSMLAVCNNACSAGYAVASAADRVSAIPSANVGSVGVLQMHVDLSGYLKDAGIKVTLLHEGDHKVDGNPFEPLPADVKKDMQAGLARHYARFVANVAANRNMSADAVRDTEARVYDGADALGIGFIDAVESPMAAVSAFAKELSGSSSQEFAMSTTTSPGAQANPAATSTTTAATPQPTAAEERARVKAILGSDEAKGRTTLAEHLAFNTEMSADAARTILAAAPQQQQAAATNPFEAAMDATQNPNVGANGGKKEDAAGSPVNAILSAYTAASGRTFDNKAAH